MAKPVLFLDEEENEESFFIGLVRLINKIEPHELFYHLNQRYRMNFHRLDDFSIPKEFYEYKHLVFSTRHKGLDTTIQFISNESIETKQIKEFDRLFVEEKKNHYLLPDFKEVDYVIKPTDNICDFSLILPVNNLLMFQIQNKEVTPEHEFFHLIQYYE